MGPIEAVKLKRRLRVTIGPRPAGVLALPRFDAVIFDMDGTLIEQLLDFQAIRAELGISPAEGILEAIQQMPPPQAARAGELLLARELDAAGKAVLTPGATEILRRIDEAGLKTALLTRNARQSMELVIAKFGLSFDLGWSRHDGPIKPEPDSIIKACSCLGVAPDRTCCVGDYLYDIVAANAAGATSVLLMSGPRRDFADQADHIIRQLAELAEILGI